MDELGYAYVTGATRSSDFPVVNALQPTFGGITDAFITKVKPDGSGVAQTTAFNYQGRLTDAGNLASGTYDMQFKLFDTVTVGTGTQQGATITNATVQVTAGSFTVTLDFGANVFDGAARFLEVGARPAGSPNPHTILAPRQAINSAPYAIQTVNATQLGGLAATRYVATDANGNVGIGTSTPTTKLDVVNSTSQLRFGPSTADNGGYLTSTNPSQAILAGGAKWDGANWIARDTVASLTAHQNGVVQFLTNGNLSVGSPFNPTLRMHIDVSGNVGIGTATPGAKLSVVGNVTQDRSSYGLPKAMVEDNQDGSIRRCYNAIANSSSGKCGFNVVYKPPDANGSGSYKINFGFDVNDRFFSFTGKLGLPSANS